MIERLNDGDRVVFLPNILKDGTYGDNIVEIERYFIHTSDGKDLYITEDPNSKKFQDLKQLYWKLISSDNKYRKIINNYKKYYSYVLLNGEYKIIDFGKTIYDKIKHYLNNHDNIDVVFIIGKKMNGMYMDYSNSFFIDIPIPSISENFLKTKSMYIEDIKANNMWTNKRNIDRIIQFLKEYDVDISKIPAIKNEIRKEKLKRILND
jgi:hypothetical protein